MLNLKRTLILLLTNVLVKPINLVYFERNKYCKKKKKTLVWIILSDFIKYINFHESSNAIYEIKKKISCNITQARFA